MMIEKIDTLIKDKYQTQLIVMDAEMKALESQINSHFLYNTLESINSIAEIEGIDRISIMTKALGDMFRYSIKTDSELVYLEEELKHINDYMVIQKIRYNNKIDAEFNIPEDLLKCKILKLILQPIVENAICHGLEYKKGSGILRINAFIEGPNIIFEILDDGIGIPAEQLSNMQRVLNEPPQFEKLGRRDKRGIGIANVNSRIKLYYGKEYGLTVSSKQNVGTCIQITVPKLQEG
jgi:two-component system sensor histidine kinase YesM